jgi:hypothetical protein
MSLSTIRWDRFRDAFEKKKGALSSGVSETSETCRVLIWLPHMNDSRTEPLGLDFVL